MTIRTDVETVIHGRDAGATATLKKVEAGALIAKKATDILNNALKGAAAFFAAKFTVGYVKSIVTAGAALATLSRGVGVSVEQLSRLRFAFEAAGVGGDKLKDVLETIEKKRAAALRGSSESVNAFGALGIDFAELQSLDAAQLLEEIAAGMEKFATQQQKASALAPLLETNLAAMAGLLGKGREAFRGMTSEADAFGTTMSTKVANDLEVVDSGMRKFLATMDAVASKIGSSVLSALFGGSGGGTVPTPGTLEYSIENTIQTMQRLSDRNASAADSFGLVGVAGLTFDEAMKVNTLSTERLSLALQELAKRLTRLILKQQQLKAGAEAQARGPVGPAFGPEARALNLEAEGEAERNSRLQPPTDNSDLARSKTTNPGFVAGLTASWDNLVQTMGTATAVGQQFGNLVGASIGGVTDILVDMVATGKSSSEAWKKFGATILAELAKIALQYAIIGAIKYAFNLGGPAPAAGAALAHGGIMGGGGTDEPMRLHKFAHGGISAGGIAGGTSLAIYGEGSRREAFVPLMDGRTIPVKIQGSGGSSVQNVYYINAIDTQSMGQALQKHGAIYRGAVRDGFALDGGDRRSARRAVR